MIAIHRVGALSVFLTSCQENLLTFRETSVLTVPSEKILYIKYSFYISEFINQSDAQGLCQMKCLCKRRLLLILHVASFWMEISWLRWIRVVVICTSITSLEERRHHMLSFRNSERRCKSDGECDALLRNKYFRRKCIRIIGEGKAWWSKGESAAACQCWWRGYRHTESSVPVCVCGASSRPEWGRGRRPTPQLVIDPSPTCSALYVQMSWPSPLLMHVLTYFLIPYNIFQTFSYMSICEQKIFVLLRLTLMAISNDIHYHDYPW